MTEASGALLTSLHYSTALFDAATMERMAGHLSVLLEVIVEDPGQRIGDLPMLTAGERELLVGGVERHRGAGAGRGRDP